MISHTEAALPRVVGAGTGEAEFVRQNASAADAHERLWGKPDALGRSTSFFARAPRAGANMPWDGTSTFHGKLRQSVDFMFALAIVAEDRGMTQDQLLDSRYSAAIAARHMLWTVLFDGNHSMSDIARRFRVDQSTVRLGIESYRAFERGELL